MNLSVAETKVYQEFLDIENKKLWKIVLMALKEESDKLTKNKTFNEARKSDNRTRNRYRDVLPYDNTRVKLADDEMSDYINASYVSLEDNKYGRRYILTQGPLESTISHFWKMVWDENTSCIVMLNKIIEKGNVKCAQYYPSAVDEDHKYPEIGLSISLIDIQTHTSYIRRLFNLKNEKTQESRKIVQFHFQSWPDFGVPSSSELFLQFLWDIKANGGLDCPNKPAVIHCSAGIGRSGTFVLIDLSLLQIYEQQSCENISLQSMLVQLRKCRIGLIQTADQLRFAYCSVILGAKALLNIENQNLDLIKFNEDPVKHLLDSEPNEFSCFGEETDSDLSENSDNNSALDKAAAAVRTRRGLPPTNECESSLFISQNNLNKENINLKSENGSYQCSSEENNRKVYREIRCNRTRQIIDQIRTKMRQQNLERDRIVYRLGLDRLVNSLARQNRTNLIAGASAIFGLFSLTCCYFAFKYSG